MAWKLPVPPKRKKIETTSKKEAAKLKKFGYLEKKRKGNKHFLEKKLSNWEYFQEEVRAFLEAHGFQDVESGRSSSFDRYQIDVVGGYEGTFLVFECKSQNQPHIKRLTKEIIAFAGKKKEIEQAIREKFGAKYNEVKFILALEDIDISETDGKTAKENDIYVWGSNYLKTGEDLFSLIGPLTLHYVLKELGVSPKPIKDDEGGADYKVPCFRLKIHEQQIYSFFIPAEKLLNLVYVFRLQPGNEDAYQRFISKKRILGSKDERGITEFINDGGFFKNSIVCSFERQVGFVSRPTGLLLNSDNIEFGILSIPKLYGTVWVIDGQHRLYGYAGADPEPKKTYLNVVAYQDIEKRQQAKDFIDINQKQKSVDPNTLWDLLSQTDPYSVRGAITKIAGKLNERGTFKGKIMIPRQKFHSKRTKYPLKLANICNTLNDRRLLDYNRPYNLYKRTVDVTNQNPYPDNVIENAVDVIDQFFSLIWEFANNTPEWRNGFILHNNGFNVFVRVLEEIMEYQKGVWNKQGAKGLLEQPVQRYFEEKFKGIKELRSLTSNEAGRARTALEIIKLINQGEVNFASNFIKQSEKREQAAFEKTEPYQVLKELETSLRRLIEGRLKQVTDNWWKERIPSEVKERAEKRQKKNERPWPWVSTEEKSQIYYIDFPDYAKIIQLNDNWEGIFKTVFKDSNMIGSKLRELEHIRNNIAHMRNISAQQSTTLKLYADQIIKAIKNPESEG